MKEDFLHYVWQHQLFSNLKLISTDGQEVVVSSVGTPNEQSGPDFFNAKITIADVLWAGNVEIHVKSSDWYLHEHEKDENYDSVILHVIWEDDVAIYDVNNQQISTLVLKDIVPQHIIENYNQLMLKKKRWIPCENVISDVDNFVLSNWKSQLYFERLEQKTMLVNDLLLKSNNDYEAVLFSLLMKNFGLKTNGDAFLKLASLIDFSILRKERYDALKLNALLYGQAGFLKNHIEDAYFLKLKSEYKYLKYKYQLKEVNGVCFQFFKMRPNNFPTVRIAQIVALYHQQESLFSKLMSITKIEDYYKLFAVKLNKFWDTHYTFQKASPKRVKKITKSFVDLLVINTIIPIKFNYYKSIYKEIDEDFFNVIRDLCPEKNGIISKFKDLGILSKNAFDTQALLQLKNNYCAKKRCLQCAIGNNLLKRT